MKKSHLLGLSFIAGVITLFLMLFIGVKIFNSYSINITSKVEYCQTLANEFAELSLNKYYCSGINHNESEGYICFDFDKRNKLYLFGEESPKRDDAINDIIKVRNTAIEYLHKNPQNELNNKKICFRFEDGGNTYRYMYNYDFTINGELEEASDLNYFIDLSADTLSSIHSLSDAKKISISVSEVDKIEFFKKFNNLGYLNIHSLDWTEEKSLLIQELLPECEVIIRPQLH